MKTTSRKVIKKPIKAATRKRADHPAGCRVSDVELVRIRHDIAEIQKGSGIPVSLGAYTKHAILEHFRLRKLETLVKDIVAREDRRQDADGVDAAEIIEALRNGIGS